MRILLAVIVIFALGGCAYGAKNLSPDQLQAIARMSEITNASGCTLGAIEGASPMVAGQGGFLVCWGVKEHVTVAEMVNAIHGQTLNITVEAP